MRAAGDSDEADILFQRALIKAGVGKGKIKSGGGSSFSTNAEGNLLDDDYGEGGPTVADQIAKVEELLKKLNLVKRERAQVLKDLKEKVGNLLPEGWFFYLTLPGANGRHIQCTHLEQEIHTQPRKPAIPGRAGKVSLTSNPSDLDRAQTTVSSQRAHQDICRPTTGQTRAVRSTEIRSHHSKSDHRDE